MGSSQSSASSSGSSGSSSGSSSNSSSRSSADGAKPTSDDPCDCDKSHWKAYRMKRVCVPLNNALEAGIGKHWEKISAPFVKVLELGFETAKKKQQVIANNNVEAKLELADSMSAFKITNNHISESLLSVVTEKVSHDCVYIYFHCAGCKKNFRYILEFGCNGTFFYHAVNDVTPEYHQLFLKNIQISYDDMMQALFDIYPMDGSKYFVFGYNCKHFADEVCDILGKYEHECNCDRKHWKAYHAEKIAVCGSPELYFLWFNCSQCEGTFYFVLDIGYDGISFRHEDYKVLPENVSEEINICVPYKHLENCFETVYEDLGNRYNERHRRVWEELKEFGF